MLTNWNLYRHTVWFQDAESNLQKDTTEMDKRKLKKSLMHLLIEVLAGLIIAKQTVEELFCSRCITSIKTSLRFSLSFWHVCMIVTDIEHLLLILWIQEQGICIWFIAGQHNLETGYLHGKHSKANINNNNFTNKKYYFIWNIYTVDKMQDEWIKKMLHNM